MESASRIKGLELHTYVVTQHVAGGRGSAETEMNIVSVGDTTTYTLLVLRDAYWRCGALQGYLKSL